MKLSDDKDAEYISGHDLEPRDSWFFMLKDIDYFIFALLLSVFIIRSEPSQLRASFRDISKNQWVSEDSLLICKTICP